jgi:serine/threonine protein kinase
LWARRIAAHRDIKADNIFIDGEGRLVVGDLGRVKFPPDHVDEATASATAVVHTVTDSHTDFGVGNTKYMSRQYATGQRYNPQKEDVYCCGTLLAVMSSSGRLQHDPRKDDAQNQRDTAARIAETRGAMLSRAYTCLVEKRPDMLLLEEIVRDSPPNEAAARLREAAARASWCAREQQRGGQPDDAQFDAIWHGLEWLRVTPSATDAELKAALPGLRLESVDSDAAMDHGLLLG